MKGDLVMKEGRRAERKKKGVRESRRVRKKKGNLSRDSMGNKCYKSHTLQHTRNTLGTHTNQVEFNNFV